MKEFKVWLLKTIKDVKPWYLIILTLVSAAVCIYALRSNNQHMNQLRNQVNTADKDNGNVSAALEKLAKYVTSNMNTDLSSGANPIYPPIQLTYAYQRASESEAQAIEQQNTSLYTEAEDYCQSQIPQGFSGRYRVPCIEEYVNSHGLKEAAVPVSLYEFDFISPTWSPDVAGWTLLTTIVLAILSIASLIFYWHLKKEAKAKT